MKKPTSFPIINYSAAVVQHTASYSRSLRSLEHEAYVVIPPLAYSLGSPYQYDRAVVLVVNVSTQLIDDWHPNASWLVIPSAKIRKIPIASKLYLKKHLSYTIT